MKSDYFFLKKVSFVCPDTIIVIVGVGVGVGVVICGIPLAFGTI